MGSLNLPTAGQVYIETPTLIYTVERHPTYGPLLAPFWQAASAGQLAPISSDLIIAEALVMPLRQGNVELQASYEAALFEADLELLPLTQDILREAARLWAMITGLRTPDALHAATALVNGCALFLTNDIGFRRVPGLPLAILDDVLAA